MDELCFNKNNELAISILDKKEFASLNELILVVQYLSTLFPYDKIIEELKDFDVKFEIDGVAPSSLIRLAYLTRKSESKTEGFGEGLPFYEGELEHLNQINNSWTRKILFILLVVSKFSDHPSGWIRYSREGLFKFWHFNKNEKTKQEIMKDCCNNGLELRVIGSKCPMTCFKLDFREYSGFPIFSIHNEQEIYSYYDLFWKESL